MTAQGASARKNGKKDGGEKEKEKEGKGTGGGTFRNP